MSRDLHAATAIAEATGIYYRRLLKELPAAVRSDGQTALVLALQFQRLYVAALLGVSPSLTDEVTE